MIVHVMAGVVSLLLGFYRIWYTEYAEIPSIKKFTHHPRILFFVRVASVQSGLMFTAIGVYHVINGFGSIPDSPVLNAVFMGITALYLGSAVFFILLIYRSLFMSELVNLLMLLALVLLQSAL